jgi:hypothetical protein
VSQYIVRKGRALQKNLWHSSRILKEERSAFVWCCYTVIQFYENDEYSHLCPGKKDLTSVKQQHEETTHWKHEQKRLVLCNLQGLYVAFCEKHPTVSNGFSKLAELCPKHCILVGARGTHTVCVYVIHQNRTLIAQRAHLTSDFNTKNLEKIVCSTESEMCFNTVSKLPWLWCSMQVTLYNGQFWIWRWNHIQTVGDDRPLNFNDYCCPMWRMYWLTDKIWTTFHPHSFYPVQRKFKWIWMLYYKILQKITLSWFRMQCKGIIGPMTM